MKLGRRVLIILSVGIIFTNCKETEENKEEVSEKVSLIIPEDKDWSERMMLSEMERFPEAWMLDFHNAPRWSYPNGLVLKASKGVYEETGNGIFKEYIKEYIDTLVTDDGEIKTYTREAYNLDLINSGKVLLDLFEETKEDKYRKSAQVLREQLDEQPRTSEGGFWHKKRYTNQMWLDGLYMAQPFYTRYTNMFSQGEEAEKAYDDILNQFDLIQKNTRDDETGLLYHGYDESREQEWANDKTGTSPHFWSRAMGWYGMALVDVLDHFPEEHEGRQKILNYLLQFSEAIVKVQDKETGLWYQVLDLGDRDGNYLEASGSSMFIYTLAKSVRKGYLPEKYLENAKKGYQGILANLISIDDNGIVNLNQVCAVAGLGGSPYRDGSFDYYVNEKIRTNDPKGTGPFILASLEMEKLK